MSDKTASDVPALQGPGDIWAKPEILVQLLNHELDTGYKLVTFYTACATAYATLAGFAVKYYFDCFEKYRDVAKLIALFGLVLGMISLCAPVGLEISRREIARKANRYAAALGLPDERFTVIRVGMWLSVALFTMIVLAWILLILRA